ncbi:MAG TPA: alkaline phosphatase family protein [Vicinamibacterales bacterium]
MLVKRLAPSAALTLLLTAAGLHAGSDAGTKVPALQVAARQVPAPGGIRSAGTSVPASPAVGQNTAAAFAPAAKLVVVIVLDQVRADYLERFADDWAGGLQRLTKTGAWFTNAAYPYLVTATCAGHATVSSGALPHTSGIVHNEWFDRRQGKVVTCTADPSVRNIAYGAQATGGDSPAALRVPALADRLRSERSARVVTLSLKDRSAIMLAGHGPATVIWRTGLAWVTSTAYSAGPVDEVTSALAAHPMEDDFTKVWERLLPASRYRAPDDGAGEMPPRGWTTTFPHDLKANSSRPDLDFETRWERSPFADGYLGRLAADLVERFRLGRGAGVDFLGVSFSGPDRVGHLFGPDSQEIQDLLLRLDRTLGTLFDRLDAAVGRDGYVVALTADHGVTPIPAQRAARGASAGTLQPSTIVERVESVLADSLGPGKHVAWLDGLNLNMYLAPGVYERLSTSKPLLERVERAVTGVTGVRAVFRRDQLANGAASHDPLTRAAALGFDPERSGDLIIALKPGWSPAAQFAAVHWNTASPDDQRVPVLLMGAGVRAGRYDRPITPADIAPTLAKIAGVSLPAAEGRPLADALLGGSAPASRRETNR